MVFEGRLSSGMASHPIIQTARELHCRLSVLGLDISYRQVVCLVKERGIKLNLDLLAGIESALGCKFENPLGLQENAENEYLQRVCAQQNIEWIVRAGKGPLRPLAVIDEQYAARADNLRHFIMFLNRREGAGGSEFIF